MCLIFSKRQNPEENINKKRKLVISFFNTFDQKKSCDLKISRIILLLFPVFDK